MENSHREESQPLLVQGHTSSSGKSRASCTRCGIKTVVVSVVLVLLVAGVILGLFLSKEDGEVSASGQYRSAAVVSDHVACSKIGSDIMEKLNGSAVDAAIATVLCTGVTGAQASGIGGGHFMTIYDTPRGGDKKEVMTINGRSMAPAASSQDMFKNVSSSKGALAVAVPGEVRGLYEAWKTYGKLPWKQLVQPTIDLCIHGFKVSKTLASRSKMSERNLRKFPGTRSAFLKPDGSSYVEGDIMRRPVLAVTLRRMVDEGPESFYTGRLAQDIIRDLTDVGGILTADDLRDYEVIVDSPLAIPLQNFANQSFDLYVPPLPSGGPILQFLLRVLNGYNFTKESLQDLKQNTDLHQVFLETFKFGFALRSFLGDDTFSDMSEPLRNLSSDEFIKSVQSRIDLKQTHGFPYYGSAYLPAEDHGTSQVAVVGPWGSAVSITTSINGYFGSCIYGERTGILFNNDMDDFSSPDTNNDWGIRPSAANFIAPKKRPLSSMTPTIVLDHVTKMPRLVIGGAGGSRITTMVALTSHLNLMLGVDLLDAVDFPRVHHQLLPDLASYEPNVDKGVLSALRKKGHNTLRSIYVAVVCGVERRRALNGTFYYGAVGDRRRNAVPWGWN